MQDDIEIDTPQDGVTRRDLFRIGNVLAMPVLMGAASARAAAAAARSAQAGPEIYQSIGVEPVINCRGTFTIIGGVGGAARSARRDGRGLAALRPDRRTGRRRRADGSPS